MDTNSGSHKKEVIDKLASRKISLHDVSESMPESEAEKIRHEFLERVAGKKLGPIMPCVIDADSCKSNIENMAGEIHMPLGIAGPLKMNGEYAKGEFFLPLATTEGALVASVSRGCNIISKSGGAEAMIIKSGQTRSVLFKVRSVSDGKRLLAWVSENFDILKKEGETGEKFLDIKEIIPYIVGLNVWLRIVADTKDAMGMNMITIAGKNIARYISDKLDYAEFISESGNLCIDKKPGAINLIESRGKRVIASVELDAEDIKKILKTTSEKLIDMNYRKNLLGSAVSGSLGYNAHFANMIAALFIATGQDAAHVVDGSLGFTTVEKSEKGVVFSVTLTSLQAGTVGGGTGLPSQKACLSILGCEGPGNPAGSNSAKLAEIFAGAVLAGEISLLAALCTGDLAKAHQELNRKT